MPSALERCVGDPGRFIDDVWARAPVLRPGADPDGFRDLLTLDDVDHIVSSTALRLPAFRLIKDGATLPESAYTKSGRAGSKPMTGLADPARIFGLFDQGATIVLQGVHRFWLPLARFCRELEIALGHPTQVNAYVTPPGSRGLEVHEDAHDVFVLQAFGTKSWDVWPTRGSGSLSGTRLDEGQPAISADLRPGDAMYMPRRTPHAARTQKTLSGHLTIGVLSITWRDALREATDRVLDLPEFDLPLPAGYHADRAAFAGRFEAALSDVARHLEKLDPRETADRAADRFLSSRPPLLRGSLAARSELDSVDDHTTVGRRAGSICEVRPGGEAMTVLLGDRILTMPARCESAMREIAGREGFQVGDLEPYLDHPGRLVLVRRLIREGLLEVLGEG